MSPSDQGWGEAPLLFLGFGRFFEYNPLLYLRLDSLYSILLKEGLYLLGEGQSLYRIIYHRHCNMEASILIVDGTPGTV